MCYHYLIKAGLQSSNILRIGAEAIGTFPGEGKRVVFAARYGQVDGPVV